MKHVNADEHFYSADALAPRKAIIPLRGVYSGAGKRAIDFFIALALVPIVGPLVAVLAFLVYVRDGGAPFFGHKRVGLDGREFRCWKIRSMVRDSQERLARHLAENPSAAAEWAGTRKLTDDPRITAVGGLLRKTSLDELPQLWNVLKGEMSFVGPRPVPNDELNELYGPARAVYCSMKPGITGLWQVSGRNDVSYAQRVSLDIEYLRRMAPMFDLWVMLRTVLVVVRPTGR